MWRKLIDKLKNPAPVFAIAVFVIAVALIAASIALVALGVEGAWTYLIFALAAILLGYAVWLAAKCAHSLKKFVAQWTQRHIPEDSLLHDYGYRTVLMSALALAINIGYAVLLAVMGIVYHSIWYGALAAYYIFLSADRLYVVASARRQRKRGVDLGGREQLRTYAICGASLVVLAAAMSAAVAQMVMDDSHSDVARWMAIATAAYTFYKVISAAVNFARSKKHTDHAARALRNIGLADALISIVSLETTMLGVFGTSGELNIFKAISGALACAATVAIGAAMMVVAVRKLRRKPQDGDADGEDSDV